MVAIKSSKQSFSDLCGITSANIPVAGVELNPIINTILRRRLTVRLLLPEPSCL